MNSFHTGLYSLNSFPPGNAVLCGAFRELCLFHPDFDRWSWICTRSALRVYGLPPLDAQGRGLPAWLRLAAARIRLPPVRISTSP